MFTYLHTHTYVHIDIFAYVHIYICTFAHLNNQWFKTSLVRWRRCRAEDVGNFRAHALWPARDPWCSTGLQMAGRWLVKSRVW